MPDHRYEYRDGAFVSQRVSQIVQAIVEYCPEIEVQWIHPSERTPDVAAYRIVHNPPNGEPYVIFHVKNDEDFDARVLKDIMMSDARTGKVQLSEIEASEQAARRIAHQRFMDGIMESNEIAGAVLASNKDTYKVHDGLVISQTKKGNQAVKPKYFT